MKSSFFFSSWLITQFCTILQYREKSALLEKILLLFFLYGFKGTLKSILVLLFLLKDQIVGLSFEQTLEFLNNIHANAIFSLPEQHPYVTNFMEKARDFKIRQKHIDRFQSLLKEQQ